MERQSTSKFFRILIAIAAFFILCSSSLLFAACDSTTSVKNHEHTINTDADPFAETGASCTVAGTKTYKCTDEDCAYVETFVVTLPTGHTWGDDDVCDVCKLKKSDADKLEDANYSIVTQAFLKGQIDELKTQLSDVATNTALQATLTTEMFKTLIDQKLEALKTGLLGDVTGLAGATDSRIEAAQQAVLNAIKELPEDADINAVKQAVLDAIKALPDDADIQSILTAIQALPDDADVNAAKQAVLDAIKELPTKSEVTAALNEAVTKTITDTVAQVLSGILGEGNKTLSEVVADLKSADDTRKAEILSKLEEKVNELTTLDGQTKQALLDKIAEAQSGLEDKIGAIQTALTTLVQTELSETETNLKDYLDTNVTQALETYLDGIQTALQGDLSDLKSYLGGDGFLGQIMGETGLAGIMRMVEGYLGEGSDTAQALENIEKQLTQDLKNQIASVLATLQEGQSGIESAVGNLASQLTQAVTDVLGAVDQIPTTEELTSALQTQVTQQLTTFLTGSEYTTAIVDAIKGAFDSEALNSLLGYTDTTLKAELDEQFQGINDAISAAQQAIMEELESGTTGQSITSLEAMVKQLYKDILNKEYVPAMSDPGVVGPDMFGATDGEKPEGMLNQVDDLWDKVKALQAAVAEIPTDHQDVLDALQDKISNIVFPSGEYTTQFEELKNEYDQILAKYEEIKGVVDKINTQYETLGNKVDKVQEALTGTDGNGGLVKSISDIADQLTTLSDGLSKYVENSALFQKYVEDIEQVYDAFHEMFGETSFADLLTILKEFYKKAVDNNYFQEAINAAKGLKNFLGTTESSGVPTITLEQIKGYFDNINTMLSQIKDHGYDADGADHVHDWVFKLAKLEGSDYTLADEGTKPVCLQENTYLRVCSICGEVQTSKTTGKPVTYTEPAADHVVNYTKGAEEEGHHYDATCVNPATVQAYCVNCGEYVEGLWASVGAPTYQHHYVLEDGTDFEGAATPGAVAHSCTSVHNFVYHCETCGGAYVVPGASVENPDPSGEGTTPHDYYSKYENGKPTGEPLSAEEKLKLYTDYAAGQKDVVDTWSATEGTAEAKLAVAETVLKPWQRYEALKSNLNKVFEGNATCVDPALIVVECVECGVRYAYSYSTPFGHTLVLQTAGLADTKTCTTDGVAPYYYCTECHYYFRFVNESGKTVLVEEAGSSAKFSTDYLVSKTGEIINGEPKDEDGVLTAAGQLAYDACAEKAYGHTFVPAFTRTVHADCGWADRSFEICTVCGETKTGEGTLKADDGYGKKDAEYTWTPEQYKVADDGEYYDGTPDFINNLKAYTESEEGYNGKTGLEAAVEKLTELGYFKDVDSATLEALEDFDALIEFAVTGWNVSPIRVADDFNAHTFVPVFVGDDPTCLKAQDYILVCSKCFKYEEKAFADCFELAEDGDHYVIKAEAGIEAAEIVNKAQTIEDNSELAKSWANLKDTATSATDYAEWYVAHGYFVRSVEDDETRESVKAYFATLDLTDDIDKIQSFYGEGKNAIDTGLQLPVQGHKFSDFVFTVTDNCVMYARKVYYCTVCGESIMSPEVSEDAVARLVTPVEDATTVPDNDLAGEWAAVYKDGEGSVEEIVVWLANHGYFNAERELLGQELYVGGVFQTIAKDDESYTKLVAFLGEAAETAEGLEEYFTASNATREFTVTQTCDAETGALEPIVLGHTFEAIYVKSASCETGGTYVYVCTTCGMAEKPTATFSYTIDKQDYPTDLVQALNFTLKADSNAELTEAPDDQSLFEEAVPEARRTEINEGKTDLECYIETVIGEDDTVTNEDAIKALSDMGYLNTLIDTLAGIGQAGYDKDAPYELDWDALYDMIGELITDGTIKGISDFYTGLNQTLDTIGTTVPTMNHLMKDGQGHDVNADTPLCTEFQDEQLTEWFNAGYSAEWKDGKWQQGPKFDMSMFDEATHPLNHAWYVGAQTYGIIGACAREDCPQHTEDYVNKETAVDGTYTAGYVAATDHQMGYEKFKARVSNPGEPSAEVEEVQVIYNLNKVDAYNDEKTAASYLDDGKTWADATDDEKLAAAQKAMDADYLNLYTLQKIYNYQNIDAKTIATYGLETLEVEKDVVDQTWMPLTHEDNPSCWLDLRCKWYHKSEDGLKCTAQGLPTSHTMPSASDWNYSSKAANCQHGDKCYTCDRDMTGTTGHSLIKVTDLSEELLEAWNHLFASELFADVNPEGYDQDTLFAPTCSEPGMMIYVCTGELERYAAGGYELDESAWIKEEVGLEKDEYDHNVGTNPNATYYVETVNELTDHHYVEHRYYLTGGLGVAGKEITEEEWNHGFNRIICLYGYYTKMICDNTLRDGHTVCNHEDEEAYREYKAANHTLAPIEEYWRSARYQASTTERNAIVEHVCVICGEHVVGIYGDVTDGKSSRVQYNIATPAQIAEWNENGAVDPSLALDKLEKVNAQEIRPEDYKKEVGTTGTVSASMWNHNANYTYTEDTTLTLEEGKNGFLVGSNLNPQVTIGKGTTLTLSGEEEDVGLEVWGAKLTIKGEDKATSVLDLTDLGKGTRQAVSLTQAGTVLTLENLTVKLGDTANSVIFPQGGRYGGSKVVVKNCVIVKEGSGAPIQTSQNSRGMCRDVEIEITDSVIVSKDDTALFVNEGGTSNMPAKVTATNSKFYGKNIGVVIRGGNATFTNCTFATEAGVSYSGSDWGDGTNIPVSAGIVIGSQNPVKEYGNANVTLNGCTFQLGTYEDFAGENEIATVAMTSTFSGTDYTIAVFGNETNEAICTVDYATHTAANGAIKTSGEGAHLVLPEVALEDLGENPEQAAAELVKSFAATGGVVTLPAGIEEGITIEDQFLTLWVDTTIDLNGNQLNLKQTSAVTGSLTLEGGTVVASDQISVQQGGHLTLSNVELVSSEDSKGGWLLAAPLQDATITIVDSLLYTSKGASGIALNAAQSGEVTLILIDSAVICDCADGDGRFALLLNKHDAKLYAGGCTFYGTNGAAWIRGGEAHFMGCTFIGGNVATTFDTTGTGSQLAKDYCGAVVVGGPLGNTNYGSANVEFVDCTAELKAGTLLDGNTLTATKSGDNRNGYDYALDEAGNVTLSENETKTVSEWVVATNPTATPDPVDGAAKGNDKVLVVLAGGTNTTTVEFSDINTAKSFLGENLELKKGTNLYLENGATLANVSVSYKDDDGNDVTIDPVIELTAENVADEAPAALKDAAANGGKVVLPEAAEEPVVVGETLAVAEGKNLEVVLGEQTLTMAKDTGIFAGKDSTLKISGGKISTTVSNPDTDHASLVGVSQNGIIELTDTELTTDGGYAVGLDQTASGSKLTLTNVKVTAQIGITVNGQVTNAEVTLTNSTFLADNAIGCYLAGNATITATGCVFYGSVTAAEVVSGNVTFDGCTFASGADQTGWAAPSATTSFVGGAAGFPGAYAGHITVVEKENYQRPLTLTLKGETTWVSIDTNKGEQYAVKDVFKTQDETNDTAFYDGQGEVIGYYKKAAEEYHRVTVAIVDANYATAETPIVTLVTDGDENKLALEIDANVWVFTSDEASTKVSSPAVDDVQKVLKLEGTAGTTLSAAKA